MLLLRAGSGLTYRNEVRMVFTEKWHMFGQAVHGGMGVAWSDVAGALNACWRSEAHVQSSYI